MHLAGFLLQGRQPSETKREPPDGIIRSLQQLAVSVFGDSKRLFGVTNLQAEVKKTVEANVAKNRIVDPWPDAAQPGSRKEYSN